MDIRLAPLVGRLSRVSEVVVRPFAPDDPSTPKGANTWNLLYPDEIISGRTMVARRYRGQLVGDHFHPRHPTKDPERFLLIMGDIRFHFEDFEGNMRVIGMNADRDGPLELHIPPYLLHRMEVVSETTWFLEQQADAWSPELSFGPEEFRTFCLHYGSNR
jgi:hypothetical protein